MRVTIADFTASTGADMARDGAGSFFAKEQTQRRASTAVTVIIFFICPPRFSPHAIVKVASDYLKSTKVQVQRVGNGCGPISNSQKSRGNDAYYRGFRARASSRGY